MTVRTIRITLQKQQENSSLEREAELAGILRREDYNALYT
jgi:hypothetical protein